MDEQKGFFTAWQDRILETARRALVEDGHVQSIGFVLTRPGNLPPGLRTEVLECSPGLEFAVLVLPLPPPATELLPVLIEDFIRPERQDVFVEKAREVIELGESFGMSREDAARRFLDGALERLAIDPKDVMLGCIRRLLALTDATAWVQVTEAYWLATDQPRRREELDLSEDPAASECIVVTMETHSASRVVTLPFTRSVRDTGEVVGFGSVIDGGMGAVVEGRMLGLLSPRGMAC